MSKPELETIFSHGGEHDSKIKLQYDKKTNELYVNDKRVVTEVGFSKWQKVLATSVSLAIVVQAVMAIFSYFKC